MKEQKERQKTKQHSVFFSEDERILILKACQKSGLCLSAFLRNAGILRARELNCDFSKE